MLRGNLGPVALGERGEAVRRGLDKLELLRSLGYAASNHLKEAARINDDIEAQRDNSEVPAPLGFLFTVTIRNGRFPLSFRGDYDTEKGRETWSAPEVHKMIGNYTFLASSIDVGENTGDTIAPIFARSGDMRCLVTDETMVGVVLVDEAPRGPGQVINHFITR